MGIPLPPGPRLKVVFQIGIAGHYRHEVFGVLSGYERPPKVGVQHSARGVDDGLQVGGKELFRRRRYVGQEAFRAADNLRLVLGLSYELSEGLGALANAVNGDLPTVAVKEPRRIALLYQRIHLGYGSEKPVFIHNRGLLQKNVQY